MKRFKTLILTLATLAIFGSAVSYAATILPTPQGGTGRGTGNLFTPYAVITGGTTATGALQNVAALGASGTVLTSNGAGALPTFQTLSIPSNTLAAVSAASTTTPNSLYTMTSTIPVEFRRSGGTTQLYLNENGFATVGGQMVSAFQSDAAGSLMISGTTQSELYFYRGSNSVNQKAYGIYLDSLGKLNFNTRDDSNTSGINTVAAFDRSGNFGVGTSSPTAAITMSRPSAANGTAVDIINGNAGTDATLGPIGFSIGVLPSATAGSRYGYFVFGDNSNARSMILNYAPGGNVYGNIGIGTTSPVSYLSVNTAPSASANVGTITLGGGAWSSTGRFSGSSSGTSFAINEVSSYAGSLVDWQVAGVSKVKITSAGDTTLAGTMQAFPSTGLPGKFVFQSVGQGTPTLSGGETLILQRNVTSAYDNELLLIGGTAAGSKITFGTSATKLLGQINYDNVSNFMAFYTNGTEKLRIDTSGNILAGGTATNNANGIYYGSGIINGANAGLFVGATSNQILLSSGGGTYGNSAVVSAWTGTGTRTSGDMLHFAINSTFAPTSGTATYENLVLSPTINQTGGASGITYGLVVSPTLTAAAAFHAFQINLAPPASADFGLINIGGGTFNGGAGANFSGSSNGTIIAINKTTSADIMRVFLNGPSGVDTFRIDGNGGIPLIGGGAAAINSNGSVSFANGNFTVATSGATVAASSITSNTGGITSIKSSSGQVNINTNGTGSSDNSYISFANLAGSTKYWQISGGASNADDFAIYGNSSNISVGGIFYASKNNGTGFTAINNNNQGDIRSVQNIRISTAGNVSIGTNADATSKLTVGGTFNTTGGVSFPYVAKTATYTATTSDYEIDCTANTFTVSLPNSTAGLTQLFVVTNSGAGVITVTTVGGTQIVGNNGIATTATVAAGSSTTFHATGTGYRIN